MRVAASLIGWVAHVFKELPICEKPLIIQLQQKYLNSDLMSKVRLMGCGWRVISQKDIEDNRTTSLFFKVSPPPPPIPVSPSVSLFTPSSSTWFGKVSDSALICYTKGARTNVSYLCFLAKCIVCSSKKPIQEIFPGISLVVQWLRLSTPIARRLVLIPGQETIS